MFPKGHSASGGSSVPEEIEDFDWICFNPVLKNKASYVDVRENMSFYELFELNAVIAYQEDMEQLAINRSAK